MGWGNAGSQDFTVTGVLEQPAHNSISFIGRQEQSVFIPFDNVFAFFGAADFDTDWGIYNERIASAWREVYPGLVFETYFVDRQWEEMHRWITRTADVTRLAAGVAILIAFVGLLGLVSISVLQRTREIGIRKGLGAGMVHLIQLLSREYVLLVGIAFLIAAPVVYLALQYWLEGFAQRIGIEPGVFVVTGVLTLLGTFLMVGIQAFKTASTNPVETLRQEV